MNQTVLFLSRAHPQMPSPIHHSSVADPVQWNLMMKLVMLSLLATVGTIGNVFAVSAVMLDDQLRKKGNMFIVNLALADLGVSALAIPASSLTILAGHPDDPSVCSFQWAAAILCCHISVLTLMFVALENQERILSCVFSAPPPPPPGSRSAAGGANFSSTVSGATMATTNPLPRPKQLFGKTEIVTAISATWITSSVCVACQFSLGLGPDYCRMVFKGHLFYHVMVGAFLFCVPTVVAFAAYFRCLTALRDSKCAAALQQALLTSRTLAKDVELMKANFAVFLVFLASWFPWGVAVAAGSLRPVSRRLYEHLSWIALSNSCVNSFVYGLRNRFFRATYAKLFNYCFCRTSVSFGRGPSSGPSSSASHAGGAPLVLTRHGPLSNPVASLPADGCSPYVSDPPVVAGPTRYGGGGGPSTSFAAAGPSSSSGGGGGGHGGRTTDVRVHIIPGYGGGKASRGGGLSSGQRGGGESRGNQRGGPAKYVYEL